MTKRWWKVIRGKFGVSVLVLPCDVVHETELTVTVTGPGGDTTRELKITSGHRYFETSEKAYGWAIGIARGEERAATRRLEEARSELARLTVESARVATR